jgi:uncharacterized protein (TIGR00369 family)
MTKGDKLIYEEGINKCFACGKDNPIGLKLEFQRDGEAVRARFVPTELYQGWPGIVHGGILLTMLDEAASYVSYFQGATCVTARSEVRFRHSAPVGEPLLITAYPVKMRRRLIQTRATVTMEDGTVVVEGTILMYAMENSEKERNK